MHAQDICGYDVGNPMLGPCRTNLQAWKDCLKYNTRKPEVCDRYHSGFAIYHPWLELADSQPLTLSVPTRIQIRADGSLEIEALTPTTNLDQLRFRNGQDWDLLLPTVQIQIGTKTTTVNPAPIEAVIRQKEHELVQLGLHELKEYLVEQLPAYLTAQASEHLKSGFDLVKEIGAPGAPDCPNDSQGNPTKCVLDLNWGLRPAGIGLYQELVAFNLAGYLTDPENPNEQAPAPVSHTAPPALNTLPLSEYDFALAVNNDVINRMILLGFDRGYFESVGAGSDGDGNASTVKVVGTPVMFPGPNGHGRLHLTVELHRDGSLKEWISLQDPFQVTVDLDVYMRAATSKSDAWELVIDHIDDTTAAVLPQFIDHFAGKVPARVKEEIDARNVKYASSATVIGGPFELPYNVFNFAFHSLRASFDPNGYLVFYMVYEDRYR